MPPRKPLCRRPDCRGIHHFIRPREHEEARQRRRGRDTRALEVAMSQTAVLLALHILAATVWVGGMFAAYLCLRPAAGFLEGPQRLQLWRNFFAKFFPWV